MSKVRVVYKPGGEVAVLHPAPNARRKGETEEEQLERYYQQATKRRVDPETGEEVIHKLEGLPNEDVPVANLPDRAQRDRWRGEKGQGIVVDPSVITLADRKKALEDELDAEIAAPGGNPMTAMALQRRLDREDY